MSRLPWYHIITRRLAEPAIITALQIATYVMTGSAGGLVMLGALPFLFIHAVSPITAFIVGAILLLGSILGTISCLKGVWWLERIALLLTGLGWILIIPSVLSVDSLNDTAKTFIVMLTAIAIFDNFKRYRRIDWAYLDPTK